jgi:tetratricopeptide (TPR) repeat protein
VSRAGLVALALAAACGHTRGNRAPATPEPPQREDLAAVARGLVAIDAAERRGTLDDERQRLAALAVAAPRDVAARFLALAAGPRDEQTWSGFRALLDAAPASAWPHLGMARVYAAWRLWDQLDVELGRALALAPSSWLALLVRAQAAEWRDRPAEARRDYEAVLRADPGDVEAHAGLARLHRAAGDAAAARAEAEAALAAAPDHHPSLVLLAALAQERGDAAAARASLERATRAAPRDRETRIALAKLLRDAGEGEAASEQWREAVGLREDAASLRELAELTRQANDRAGERRALERLVQVDPRPAVAWRRLAELRRLDGDEPGAGEALEKTLERDGSDGASRVALARLLLARADAAAALRELRVAGEAGEADRAALERRLHLEKLTSADVNGLQRALGHLVDRTYRDRLAEAPRLSGLIRLRATVDADGVARQVEVLEDTIHDDLVRACAYWNLKDATYPKEKPARYGFTFSFRPPQG